LRLWHCGWHLLKLGLIGEKVAVVNPDLVVREKSGEIYTVLRRVNAMLPNEFLKETQICSDTRTA
jgi:hypothetical protein